MNIFYSDTQSLYYLPKDLLDAIDLPPTTVKDIISFLKEQEDLSSVLELMDECERLDETDSESKSLLHWAALKFSRHPIHNTEIIKKCIINGIPVNQESRDGSTFFHYLIQNCQDCSETLLALVEWMAHERIPLAPHLPNGNFLSSFDLIWTNVSIPFEKKVILTDLLLKFLEKDQQTDCIRSILLLPYIKEHVSCFCVEDIIEMIRHYSRSIDLNSIIDACQTPLLFQPFLNYCYTPTTSIQIAKAMIEYGVNPNMTDKEGQCIFIYVLKNMPLCIENSIDFIAYLMKQGANPAAKNRFLIGCISQILFGLDDDLTREQQSSLLKTLYHKNVAEEIWHRQLLVNVFDIPKYKTTVYYEVLNLEGVQSLEKFYETKLLNEENIKFYSQLVDPQPGRLSNLMWVKVLSKVSDDTKRTIQQLQRTKIHHIVDNLSKVPQILKLCSKAESMHLESYTQLFETGVPSALVVSHSGIKGDSNHAVGYYNHEDYILVCNRGYASGNYMGVTIHRKSEVSEMDQLCIDLFNNMEATTFMNKHFSDRMKAPKDYLSNKIVYHLNDSPQKGGNCPISSYESLELSMLFMFINDLINDQDAAEDLARAIRDVHISHRRKETLLNYLRLHSEESREKETVDLHLLSTLATLKTSDEASDKERLVIIAAWMVRKYPFLQQRYSKSFAKKTAAPSSHATRYPLCSL